MRVMKFDENGQKFCPGCDEAKPREDYYTNKGEQSSRCKACVDAANKAWQQANPEKVREVQRAWREANEGRTYTDEGGYVKWIGYNHPIATASGLTPYHRVVLFDKIGPGEHKCHWGCGKTVSWDISYKDDYHRGLVVDHVNAIKHDNRPENLVPSCQECNTKRMVPIREALRPECSFEGCDNKVTGKNTLCRSHYQQQYLGKELTPLRKKVMAFKDENGRVCTGCDEYKAYEHFRKNIDGNYRSKCRDCLSSLAMKNMQERQAKGIECSVEDCQKPSLNKGMCQTHYNRDYAQKSKGVAA